MRTATHLVEQRDRDAALVRAGYTLMEIMVVITLIMVLAGLSVMFIPKFNESARAAEGGRLCQLWLETARQRAIRDGVPRGVRFLPQFVLKHNNTILAGTRNVIPRDITSNAISMSGGGGSLNPWAIELDMIVYVYSPLDGNGEFVQVKNPTAVNFSATFTTNHQASANVPLLIFSTRCVEAMYIEQADDFTGGALVSLGTPTASAVFPVNPPVPSIPAKPFEIGQLEGRSVFPPTVTSAPPTPQVPPQPYSLFPNNIATPDSRAAVVVVPRKYLFLNTDITGGFGGGNGTTTPPTPISTAAGTGGYDQMKLWPVQPDDYLELSGGQVWRIRNVWALQPLSVGPPTYTINPAGQTTGLIEVATTTVTTLNFFKDPTDTSGDILTVSGSGTTAGLSVGLVIDNGNPGAPAIPSLIQPGTEIAEIQSTTKIRVTPVVPGTIPSTSPVTLSFQTAPPTITTADARYKIIRAPKQLGDEKLILPDKIALDGGTNVLFGNLVVPNSIDRSVDVMFGPSGRVIGRQSAVDEIFFWVRDVSMPITEGEPTLVALRTRSGAVSAHPVNRLGGGSPYAFARDGKSE